MTEGRDRSVLARVVQYLADIAGADAEPPVFVPDVVFRSPFRPWDPSTHRRLRRLKSIDKLRPEEHLLWQGRLWIVGAIEGVRYRWPIERQRLAVGSVGELVALGQWTLPAGLLAPPELLEFALRHSWSSERTIVRRVAPTRANPHAEELLPRIRDDVERLVADYLKAAGLPDDLPIITGIDPPPDSRPSIMAATGYYLDHHPFGLDRSAVLKLWQREDLGRSALRVLYGEGPDDGAVSPPDQRPIISPLPLNDQQQRAVLASRRRTLTVVSGPPGTGKSHLVAAAAIDHVAAGDAVLIATQSLHASDVVADLLARYPMVETLRFGDAGSTRRLGDKLATGIAAPDDRYDVTSLEQRVAELDQRISRHRRELEAHIGGVAAFELALERRLAAPLWLAQQDLSTIDANELRAAARGPQARGWRSWFTRHRARRSVHRSFRARRLTAAQVDEIADSVEADQLVDAIAGRDLGLDELWLALDELMEQWRTTIGDLLEAMRRDAANSRTRESLHRLAYSLRLSAAERRAHFRLLDSEFLQVVPLWIGTLDEIEAVLPAAPALFDLVILDEASQISQLSALPGLARARKAMVVGDSRQLRHVSFVSQDAMERAAAANDLSAALASRLDDRANSAFDAATAVAPVFELTEHFRSAPHIIGFSDRTFYQGRLQLMTQHPRNEARDAIDVITVDGALDREGVSTAEVESVIRLVRRLVAKGDQSIGVVSPFPTQADALQTALLDEFSLEEIERHRLRVGTVHGFQGTERNHMIISIGAIPGDARAMEIIEDPAIFNVMVTRARSHVTVVTHFDRNTAGAGLLGRYLRHADEPPTPRRTRVHATGWTERVAREIEQHSGVRVITDYEVAGETIDIVVGEGADAFGIETEVHPRGAARHVERRLALRRAGWDLVSFHRSSCYGKEEEAIATLLSRVARGS